MIDPYEDTQAFVAVVKTAQLGADLKDVAVFFPDALFIKDEDYRDEAFGRGLFLLMQTDAKRFARILECHVANYNVLGYRLIRENPSPEGKLAGMYILSAAVKNGGEGLFEQVPPPDFFWEVMKKIQSLTSRPAEEVEKELKKIPIPEGVKEDFAEVVSPLFYWEEFKKAVQTVEKGHLVFFLAHLYSIFSAFFLVAQRAFAARRNAKPRSTQPKAASTKTNLQSPVGTVSRIEVKQIKTSLIKPQSKEKPF